MIDSHKIVEVIKRHLDIIKLQGHKKRKNRRLKNQVFKEKSETRL